MNVRSTILKRSLHQTNANHMMFPPLVFTRLILMTGMFIAIITTIVLFAWVNQPHTSHTVLLFRQDAFVNFEVSLYDLDRNVSYNFPNYIPEISAPSASLDGNQFAFSMWTAEQAQHDVFVLDIPSHTLINLSARIDLSTTQPAWSPDGKFLAMSVRNPNGQHDIYRLNVAQGTYSNLTQGVGDNTSPSWSSDGQWIVFVARRPDEPDYTHIYRIDARGEEAVTQLTEGEHYYYQPRWSPDGTMLAFSSSDNLFVMDVESGTITHVTHALDTSTNLRLLNPVWSPDSTSIAFVTAVALERDLYVVRNDGSNLRQLGVFIRDFIVPSWSTDSQSIAFIENILNTPNERTLVTNLDGEIIYEQIHDDGPYAWIQWVD